MRANLRAFLVGSLAGAAVFFVLSRAVAQAVATVTVDELHKTLKSYVTDEKHKQTIEVSGIAKFVSTKTSKRNGQDVPWMNLRIYSQNDKKLQWYVGVSLPASAFSIPPIDGEPVTVRGPVYWGHEIASIDAP